MTDCQLSLSTGADDVQLGRLSAIRWVIPKKALSAKAAKNPITRMLPEDALPKRPEPQCQRLLDLIDQAAKHTAHFQALAAFDPDRPTQDDIDNILNPLGTDDGQRKPALQALLQNLP
jgi:hypothetical protein